MVLFGARTNIRISEADLEGLKLIVAQKGTGYQTLISGILHQVASGQLQVQILWKMKKTGSTLEL